MVIAKDVKARPDISRFLTKSLMQRDDLADHLTTTPAPPPIFSGSQSDPVLYLLALNKELQAMRACYELRRLLANKLDNDMFGLCSDLSSMIWKIPQQLCVYLHFSSIVW